MTDDEHAHFMGRLVSAAADLVETVGGVGDGAWLTPEQAALVLLAAADLTYLGTKNPPPTSAESAALLHGFLDGDRPSMTTAVAQRRARNET